MLLTVFTPSYNRGHLLRACFDSLAKQDIEFEWLIIDDGSTDDTAATVADMRLESPFPIHYHWQENAGKQAAWNVACNLATGKYFIGLDSDDQITANGLSQFLTYIPILERDSKIIGVRACAVRTSDGKNDAENFFQEGQVLSWFEEFSRPSSHGERIDVLKTAEIRKFPYPVAQGTKFIPEIWFYATISAEGYRFIYSTAPVRVFLDDHTHMRLSRSSLFAHAKGHLISRTVLLNAVPGSKWIKNPVALAKTIIRLAQVRAAENVGIFSGGGLDKRAFPYLIFISPAQLILSWFK